jgi:hypothetical protein
MITSFPQLPLDDPNLHRFEHVHALDKDVPSTTMAIMIVHQAIAGGHPGNTDAATQALTGPAGAAAIQATLRPFFDTAIGQDTLAQLRAAEAVELARDALDTARRRSVLPDETVQVSDGSAKTRRQVQVGHDQCLATAAQREARGDVEHNASQPSLAVRLVLVPVLALIEVFLLIWPVTNASWTDPKSVAYAIGLVILFLLGNEFLPRWAGVTTREAREADHAAKELTQLAISAGRAGDPDKGRAAAGQVDERLVAHTRRRKLAFRAGLGVVVTIYAAVMFTRVTRLAAGLGWPLSFVLLAAGLITGFTAGAVIVLAWWWSRGNKLGDQLREYGAITDESRLMAAELADQARGEARASGTATAAAQHQLDLAEQAIHDGQHTVYVGMQKAAAVLDQASVLLPGPDNLHSPGRAIRDATLESLGQAASTVIEAQQVLDAAAPFPDSPPPNPWELRSGPRQALPNPDHVDGSQLGILHEPTTDEAAPASRRWRKPWLFAVVAGLVIAAAIVASVLVVWG